MLCLKQLFICGFLGILSSCDGLNHIDLKNLAPEGPINLFERNDIQRGELITATPVGAFSKVQLDDILKKYGISARNGVHIYKLVYQTELPTIPAVLHHASGTVVVPDGAFKVYPWISLQHGTVTGKVQAPSVSFSEGLLEASQGFLTVVQDYIGYGDAGDIFHPYMIAQFYANTGIDMLRATRSFARGKDLTLGPLFLRGYSEGGYGTMVLQKAIETDQTREFQVAASAPGAGPYDLVVTSRILGSHRLVNPVDMLFVLLSYNHWFGEEHWDLSKILNIDIPWAYQLFDGKYQNEELFSILPRETTRLFKADRLADVISETPMTREGITLRAWLTEQSLTNKGWSPTTPTRLYHCVDDTAVPVESTQSAYASFKALNRNSPVETVLIESPDPSHPYDHTTCPGFFSSLAWFEEILKE